MNESLLKQMADLLLLDFGKLEAFVVDADEVDLEKEVEAEIRQAKTEGTWSDERFRAVLEGARRRAADVVPAERSARARATRFLQQHEALWNRLRRAAPEDTAADRVQRAMGGLARSLERNLPRDREQDQRLVLRKDGKRLLASWSGASDEIDVLARARAVCTELAEVNQKLAGGLAQALRDALERGEDVLPGFEPLLGTAGEAGYRRLPPVFSHVDDATSPNVDAEARSPDDEEVAEVLEVVEAAIGADATAVSESSFVLADLSHLPPTFSHVRLEKVVGHMAAGRVGRARSYRKRLEHLLKQRLRMAGDRPAQKKAAAALTVNLRALSKTGF